MLHLRPLQPTDREALAATFDRLGAESRYRRFLGPKPKLSESELTFLTDIDHRTHEAFAAVDHDGEIVGVARYAPWANCIGVAELAVTVVDEWQGRGVGTALAQRTVAAARANRVRRLTASTLRVNEPARRLLRRLGFRSTEADAAVVSYAVALEPEARALTPCG
jgi:RimJ/RimL family protein N-acetyltransferase